MNLQPQSGSKQVKAVSNLGRDAATGTDVDFYDWLAGSDPAGSLLMLLSWLIDDLKEETDPDRVKDLLNGWRASCSDEEFGVRLQVLDRFLPAAHPFHTVKTVFV